MGINIAPYPGMEATMAGRVYRPKYTNDDGERVQSSVWWLDYSINGKRYRESARTAKKTEAEDLLAQRLADRGQAPVQRQAENTSFEDLCELIREDYRRNGRKSTDRLELSIRHLTDFFEGFTVPSINEAAVEKYITQRLRDGYARATVNRELSALKRMLHLGKQIRVVARVPHIQKLNEDNARKGFFSEDELQAILKYADPEIRPLIEVAYLCGWRKSELLSRDWRHIDFSDGWIRLEVGDTKNDEGRQFPLTDRLRSILERQHTVRERLQREMERIITPVFFRYDGPYQGKRIHNFRKQWVAAREAAGLEERIFHDFRRTCVRNMIRSGVSESVAMKLSGHRTREVFDRYAIVDEGMLKEAGAKMEEAYG